LSWIGFCRYCEGTDNEFHWSCLVSFDSCFEFCVWLWFLDIRQIFISEVDLEDSQRSICVVPLGGVAGGTKYVCNNIVFKVCSLLLNNSLTISEWKLRSHKKILFYCLIVCLKLAIDHKKHYGGDHNAAKAANHELRYLAHFYELNIPGLHFPLMCTISSYQFSFLSF
jgi:hypothetical protein